MRRWNGQSRRINYNIPATAHSTQHFVLFQFRPPVFFACIEPAPVDAICRFCSLCFLLSFLSLFPFARIVCSLAVRFDDPLKVLRYLLNNFETSLKRTFSVRPSTCCCTRTEILSDIDLFIFPSDLLPNVENAFITPEPEYACPQYRREENKNGSKQTIHLIFPTKMFSSDVIRRRSSMKYAFTLHFCCRSRSK